MAKLTPAQEQQMRILRARGSLRLTPTDRTMIALEKAGLVRQDTIPGVSHVVHWFPA